MVFCFCYFLTLVLLCRYLCLLCIGGCFGNDVACIHEMYLVRSVVKLFGAMLHHSAIGQGTAIFSLYHYSWPYWYNGKNLCQYHAYQPIVTSVYKHHNPDHKPNYWLVEWYCGCVWQSIPYIGIDLISYKARLTSFLVLKCFFIVHFTFYQVYASSQLCVALVIV